MDVSGTLLDTVALPPPPPEYPFEYEGGWAPERVWAFGGE